MHAMCHALIKRRPSVLCHPVEDHLGLTLTVELEPPWRELLRWLKLITFLWICHGDSTWWGWLNMVTQHAGDEKGLTSQLISTSSLSTQSLKGYTTPPGSMHATLYKQHCGFFYVPQESEEWKSCETGRMVFRPYSRRLECLTFCRCHCRGSTFSSVILRPWVLVQPRFEPATTCSADRHLPNWAHWAMVNVTVSNEHLHKIFLLFSFIFLNSYRIAFYSLKFL